MRVICPECGSTLALPQGLVEATLVECAGCGRCFPVQPQPVPPPSKGLLRPIILPSRPVRPTNATASIPLKPIILPPRQASRLPRTSVAIPAEVPAEDSQNYLVQPTRSPRQDHPKVETDTGVIQEIEDTSHRPTLEPTPKLPKKKKTKRFKKKKVYSDDSDGDSFGWGARLLYSIILLVVMVVIGAVFGVGKFGWLKTNKLGEFNDQVVVILESAGRRLNWTSFADANELQFKFLHDDLVSSVTQLNKLSVPSEGREFHQAAVRFLQRVDQIVTNDLLNMVKHANNSNRSQLEQRAQQLLLELDGLEDAVIQSQQAMARRNNLQLSGSSSSYIHHRRR